MPIPREGSSLRLVSALFTTLAWAVGGGGNAHCQTSPPSPGMAAAGGANPVLQLTFSPDEKLPTILPLYESSDILLDPRGDLTINDVTSDTVAQQFTPYQSGVAPVSVGRGAVWVRIHAKSTLPAEHTWWLEPGMWGFVDLFTPGRDGYSVSRSGLYLPLPERATREVDASSCTLPLRVPSGAQELTFYLRLSRDLNWGDWSKYAGVFADLLPEFARTDRRVLFFWSLVLGVLFALGLYHLILFARVGEKVYLYFGLALLARCLMAAQYYSIPREFLWPNFPRWDSFLLPLQHPLFWIPFYLFLMTFLATKTETPKTHVFLKILAASSLLAPVALWLRLPGTLLLHQFMSFIWAVVPIGVAALALRRRHKEAVLFLAANVLMLAYFVANTVARLVALDVFTLVPRWGWLVGIVLASIVFSIAVAEQIRSLQRERDRARREEADTLLKVKKRDLEAALLSVELSRTQLQALKNQLRPHFLFNALNSVAALIRTDVAAAGRTIEILGDLLRMTLQERSTEVVRLEDEVRFAERYLEIEKIRFPTRLSVVWEIAPETKSANVPHFILQPLVENAVRHGIAPRSRPGTIWISSSLEAARLFLCVRDDGVGSDGAQTPGQGVGLANTRARLHNIYGENAHLEAKNAPGGGFEVVISLPFCIPAPPELAPNPR